MSMSPYISASFLVRSPKNTVKSLTSTPLKGQKEKSMVVGSSMKLADYYWGVVYLYSLKRLFTSEYEMISMDDLERTVLKGEKQ